MLIPAVDATFLYGAIFNCASAVLDFFPPEVLDAYLDALGRLDSLGGDIMADHYFIPRSDLQLIYWAITVGRDDCAALMDEDSFLRLMDLRNKFDVFLSDRYSVQNAES